MIGIALFSQPVEGSSFFNQHLSSRLLKLNQTLVHQLPSSLSFFYYLRYENLDLEEFYHFKKISENPMIDLMILNQ
jgi:hypothetical protein